MTQQIAPLPVSENRSPRWYARGWGVAVLALVLFLSGTLVGGAGTLAVVVIKAREAARHPDQAHRVMLERMVGRLNLTPEQRERVQSVIVRRQAAMRAMRAEFQPRVRSELDTTADQIQAELNPDQGRRWRMMVDRWKENWLPAPDAVKAE